MLKLLEFILFICLALVLSAIFWSVSPWFCLFAWGLITLAGHHQFHRKPR